MSTFQDHSHLSHIPLEIAGIESPEEPNLLPLTEVAPLVVVIPVASPRHLADPGIVEASTPTDASRQTFVSGIPTPSEGSASTPFQQRAATLGRARTGLDALAVETIVVAGASEEVPATSTPVSR